MLGFAAYTGHGTAAWASLSPQQFALQYQRVSAERLCAEINHSSPSSGLSALLMDGVVHLRVKDREALRRSLSEGVGLSHRAAEQVLELFEAHGADEGWRGFDALIAESRRMCAPVLLDHAAIFDATPVVHVAEDFLQAGAHPVPAGGNVITINQGLFSAPFWVAALKRIVWGQRFGLSRTDREELLAGLPPLSPLVMRGARGAVARPEILEYQEKIRALRQGKNLDIDEAFPQLFVLLHEFGHIALGHTAEIRSWPSLPEIQRQRTLDLLERSRQLEHEADRFAAGRIGPLLPARESAQVGLAFFFGMLHAHELYETQAPLESRTHPPALQRFEHAIAEVCDDSDPPDRISRMRGFLQLFKRTGGT